MICRVHSRLMNSCQYSDLYYAPAGKTRTETRKTVILAGAYKIECCPFPDVDGELEYICRMAKVRISIVFKFFFSTLTSNPLLGCSNGLSRGGILSQQRVGFIWYSPGAIRSKYVRDLLIDRIVAALTWGVTHSLHFREGTGAWRDCLRLSLLWTTDTPQSVSDWLNVQNIMLRSTRYVQPNILTGFIRRFIL